MIKELLKKEKASWNGWTKKKWSLTGNKGIDKDGNEMEYKSTTQRLVEENPNTVFSRKYK